MLFLLSGGEIFKNVGHDDCMQEISGSFHTSNKHTVLASNVDLLFACADTSIV